MSSPVAVPYTGTIKDNRVRLVPSKQLLEFISKNIDAVTELPQNLSKSLKLCGYDVSAKVEIINDTKASVKSVKLDFKHLRELCADMEESLVTESNTMGTKEESEHTEEDARRTSGSETVLYLQDLHWLNAFFVQLRNEKGLKCYLHQFIDSCELLLPENEVIARNPVLEARCQKLREEQQNREYRKMTKNVDAVLKNYPEDTIAYQIKAINSQIIAVLQFVFSVVAGFVFGFLGVELIVGNLDFGFRLLLGIMCALIIALAEIYFLAKKLNEIDDAATAEPKLPPPPNREQKEHKD